MITLNIINSEKDLLFIEYREDFEKFKKSFLEVLEAYVKKYYPPGFKPNISDIKFRIVLDDGFDKVKFQVLINSKSFDNYEYSRFLKNAFRDYAVNELKKSCNRDIEVLFEYRK